MRDHNTIITGSGSGDGIVDRASRKSRSRVAAFTLIELLAVMAVTATLIALLLATLSGVRASFESAKCLSNLRQCGVAMLSAGAEANSRVALVGGSAASTTSWLAEVERVLGVSEALRKAAVCPTHLPRAFAGSTAQTYGVAMSPVLPDFLTTFPGGSGSTRVLYFSRLSKPSDYPLLVDSALNGGGVQWRTAWDNGNTATAQARHKGKINVLKADGSAASMSPEAYATVRGRNSNNPSMNLIYQDENGVRQQAPANSSSPN